MSAREVPRGFTVLIPARLASTRLPDKPLADIAGLPMVVRVARQAQNSAAQRCVVAADDLRIVQACEAHGVTAIMTRSDHVSGSDRLAEACTLLGLADRERSAGSADPVTGYATFMLDSPEAVTAALEEFLNGPLMLRQIKRTPA